MRVVVRIQSIVVNRERARNWLGLSNQARSRSRRTARIAAARVFKGITETTRNP
jgi:hypothetical protein